MGSHISRPADEYSIFPMPRLRTVPAKECPGGNLAGIIGEYTEAPLPTVMDPIRMILNTTTLLRSWYDPVAVNVPLTPLTNCGANLKLPKDVDPAPPRVSSLMVGLSSDWIAIIVCTG